MLAVDPDGRVFRANAAAAALFATPLDKLDGVALHDLLARGDRDRGDTRERAAREETGGAHRYEARVRTAGGERIVAAASAPLRGAEPGTAALGTIVTLRDITEERLAAEDLARSETRYRHLFEGASDAIMTFDALGRFTTVNQAGEAISGYARQELIGKFFGPLLAVESLPRAIFEFRRALAGNAGQFDSTIVRKDGERRYITVNYACPQRSREVLCMIRDATAEKQLQQQLIQSEKMAAIGQLVSGVAHELNNPLASISAFAQLLRAGPGLAADQRHSVDVITAEAKRAARIIHNLLTFARQHKAEKVLADINKVLADTLELRAYELNVRGIRLVRDFDETPPETLVDVFQLQQVLLNLITNAEQAMAEVDRPSHRLTIRSRTQSDAIRIEVEDTGPGIPPESLALIFNPFFTTKPTGKGTGLGLSISLGIVSEHNGRIRAENLKGGGCRFVVELPRIVPKRRSVPVAPSAPAPPPPGLRILVADDEEPIRIALDRFLTTAGHTVVTVSSGSEVLWRGEGDEIFDVILLDMRMPDVSGKQIFERWTRERRDLAERVVFLTGDIVSPDLQGFLSGTARPYLSKPFEFEGILRVLPKERVA
jgi:two-component system NtrC family sensor kinase